MSNIADNIKLKIKKKGWSIVEASKKSKVPIATLNGILYNEKKGINLDTIKKISDILECSVSELIGDKQYEPNEFLKESIIELNKYCYENNIIIKPENTEKIIDEINYLISKTLGKIDPLSIKLIIDLYNQP
jgi:DNA-binding Xre family transcriptional regulator